MKKDSYRIKLTTIKNANKNLEESKDEINYQDKIIEKYFFRYVSSI